MTDRIHIVPPTLDFGAYLTSTLAFALPADLTVGDLLCVHLPGRAVRRAGWLETGLAGCDYAHMVDHPTMEGTAQAFTLLTPVRTDDVPADCVLVVLPNEHTGPDLTVDGWATLSDGHPLPQPVVVAGGSNGRLPPLPPDAYPPDAQPLDVAFDLPEFLVHCRVCDICLHPEDISEGTISPECKSPGCAFTGRARPSVRDRRLLKDLVDLTAEVGAPPL